jgi:hypothetical protein
LTTVSETALVVAMEVRWVVFIFKDGLTQEHGGPCDAEVVGCCAGGHSIKQC